MDGDKTIHFGICGAPCDPFSRQRSKRFHDGSVKDHSDYGVLMTETINFYKKYEPHAGIVEQVFGFKMACSSSDRETPMNKRWYC